MSFKDYNYSVCFMLCADAHDLRLYLQLWFYISLKTFIVQSLWVQ